MHYINEQSVHRRSGMNKGKVGLIVALWLCDHWPEDGLALRQTGRKSVKNNCFIIIFEFLEFKPKNISYQYFYLEISYPEN